MNIAKTYWLLNSNVNQPKADYYKTSDKTPYERGMDALDYYRYYGGKPLNIEKMAEIFNTGERQTKELVKKMKDYSIIKEVSIDGEIWYAFNPIYGLKGKRITNTIFIIFQKELMPILPYHIINKFLGQLENVQQNIRIIE
jgi:hypothetical protein